MQAKKDVIQKWEMLGAREQEVVILACRGHTYAQIATILGVKEETVKSHIRNIMNKIDVHGVGSLQKTFHGLGIEDC